MPADKHILLDVTRTLRRMRHKRATGIDRVEQAYLKWLVETGGSFAVELDNVYHRLDRTGGAALLETCAGARHALDLRGMLRPDRARRLREAEALVRRHSVASGTIGQIARGATHYLNTGHVNLNLPAMTALGAQRIKRVALLHDMIPLEYPEFSRPGTEARMEGMLFAACLADLVLVNSLDTAERVRDQALLRSLPLPPIEALHLGLDLPKGDPASADETPEISDFICIGTIEPRKNHAFLLDLWDSFWQRGEHRWRLHIVGRRGWMNEDVFARLDSAPMMGNTVFEHGDLDDQALADLLARCRALLFPSRTEGFGLPLAEALAQGVPVIASDLPALRETGGEVPEFLPLDAPEAWQQAIFDYASASDRRRAQIERFQDWKAPTWKRHFTLLDTLLTEMMINKVVQP